MTRSARNTRLFATASVLAFIATLACVALFAVQAHAAPLPGVPILTSTSNPLPGSNFQGGDGNEDDWHALNAANAAIPAYDDWQTFAGDMGLVVSDPSNPDKQFTGSKESDPDLWDFSLPNESTPGKTNFKAIARTFEANTFLHLMFRRQARPVELGTLQFLKIVLRDNARKRKLRRYLLLALRLACVALLALLFVAGRQATS